VNFAEARARSLAALHGAERRRSIAAEADARLNACEAPVALHVMRAVPMGGEIFPVCSCGSYIGLACETWEQAETSECLWEQFEAEQAARYERERIAIQRIVDRRRALWDSAQQHDPRR
jgi:hypothetical protein